MNITLHTKDGFDLDANYYSGTNEIGVIFIPGITSEYYEEQPFILASEKLAEKGFSVLLLNFRAHGKSTGESVKDFTISSQLKDIDTTVHFLREKGVKKIYLAGASFGGAAAVLYTEKHRDEISRLLLSNPVLHYNMSLIKWIEKYGATEKLLEQQGFVEIGSKKYKLGKELFHEMKEYYPLQALHAFHKPLLLIHGDKDAIIAYQESVAGFEELENPNKKFSLVIGADHGFHDEPFTSQVAEQIVEFFSTS